MPLRCSAWIAKREGRQWMRKVVSCNPPSLEPFFIYNTRMLFPVFPRVATAPLSAGWHCTTGVGIAPVGKSDAMGPFRKQRMRTRRHSESLFRVNTCMIVKQVSRGGRIWHGIRRYSCSLLCAKLHEEDIMWLFHAFFNSFLESVPVSPLRRRSVLLT